jgi:hypothetical protein
MAALTAPDRLVQTALLATEELERLSGEMVRAADDRTWAVRALHYEHDWTWQAIGDAIGTSQQQATKIGQRRTGQ